jgi:hypothetical protein
MQMYWTPFITHFSSINFNGWRADKETALTFFFFFFFFVKTLIKELKRLKLLGA